MYMDGLLCSSPRDDQGEVFERTGEVQEWSVNGSSRRRRLVYDGGGSLMEACL